MDIQIKTDRNGKGYRLQREAELLHVRCFPGANKFQIKDIVEKLYNVRVERVNIANYAGKRVQRYTKGGLIRGRHDAFKKAYVTVAEGQKIDYYSNI